MNKERDLFSYQVGGSLSPQSPSYVERQADRELEQALKEGQFCYVLNSRQMGKSSLRVRVMKKLQAEETICIFIDLTGMGTQDLTPEKWYAGIVRSLVSGCQLKFNWRSWWREKRDLCSPVQRLSLFIEEVLLVEVSQKIVIFIDEIDRVLSQNFSLDDFFSLIHSCYQKRQTNLDYNRLTFTLLGVASPRDLIRDKTSSPFDLGRAITLRGFQLEETSALILGLANKILNPKQIVADILSWTGGQPFLTQKLCQLIVKENCKTVEIAEIVERYIIDDWEVKDEPEHLRTIRDRLCYRDSSKTIRLLGLYKEIIQKKVIKIDNSSEQIELRLSGLVVEKKGKLVINNLIYAKVFDLAWVDRHLEQLRPYENALTNWITYKNTNYLLKGEELQTALTWSLGKSLANIDYQFLVASQELAKKEIENTLAIVEQAGKLLANNRKKASIKVSSQRLDKKWLLIIVSAVTGFVLLLRLSGILQIWEWNLLDRFFDWRLSTTQESRVLVVTIDEKDLTNIGKWPIPDLALATAIENLKARQPNAIALDVHRDLAVPPGHQKLLEIFNSTPNLYVVEKIIGNQIAPPKNIDRDRVGFSDIVLDTDRKIRRALLSTVDKDRQTRFSLGTILALHYLQSRNIQLELIGNNRYRLGKAIFKRFNGNNGGYVSADEGGYQILLNFWGTDANFKQYSLTDVINNNIKTQDIQNKLILIGSTAESIKDLFYTPYSKGWFGYSSKMPGVFIHANVTSQIISAAIDNRPLLNTYNRFIESLWILLWGVIGGTIFWYWRKLFAIALNVIFVGTFLIFICYRAFLSGLWLPLVPSLMVLVLTIIILIIVKIKQTEQQKFNYILKLLLKQYLDHPLVSRIALEYLKRSESKANSSIIEKKIRQLNQ